MRQKAQGMTQKSNELAARKAATPPAATPPAATPPAATPPAGGGNKPKSLFDVSAEQRARAAQKAADPATRQAEIAAAEARGAAQALKKKKIEGMRQKADEIATRRNAAPVETTPVTTAPVETTTTDPGTIGSSFGNAKKLLYGAGALTAAGTGIVGGGAVVGGIAAGKAQNQLATQMGYNHGVR